MRSLYGDEVRTAKTSIQMVERSGECARVWSGTGTPDESTPEGMAQQNRLAKWVRLLEDEQVMEYVIAVVHAVPLLAEYAPRINPQQLKNALISRAGMRPRGAHDSGSMASFRPTACMRRWAKLRDAAGAERAKVAARFLQRFHPATTAICAGSEVLNARARFA